MITDKQQIRSLLIRLMGAHGELNLTFSDGIPDQFIARLLKLDSSEEELVIGGLTPQPGSRQITPGRELEVTATLDGGELHFSSEVERLGNQGAAFVYRLAMPEWVEHHQMRSIDRVRLFPRITVPARLSSPDTDINGKLADLSQNGAGIYVSRTLPVQPSIGRREQWECILKINKTTVIKSQVEICFVARQGAHLRVGVQFCELEADGRKQLQSYITSARRLLSREQRNRGDNDAQSTTQQQLSGSG
jgi:c-di-GMP-binding flagellar brake protein YcgR